MSRILICFIVAYSLLLGVACDKSKTLTRLENIATELRIHNLNISRVSNEFHEAGKLDDTLHKGILTAASKFSVALDSADAAIVAAKKVTEGMEGKAALDYAQRLLDTEVFGAFVSIVAAVTNVPPEIKARIETILASIRLAFATIRNLLGQSVPQIRQEAYNNVG